ncbi:serine/threonine protein kinase [Myxococcota bacterium]|nr:serine/threonine protein kinase [Myxococcota bacterium]
MGASPVASRDEHVGRVFCGKYRVDQLVARGGMGRVYRGVQYPLGRPVAIKVLSRELNRNDPQFARRFTLEAATAAKLAHPHTITVFDYGETETGDLFIAMEYLQGRSLAKLLEEEGRLSVHRALAIALQVARAVREAHQMGVIHRDLKPGNIFLCDEADEGDYAKVLDFGLVKLFRPSPEDRGAHADEPGAFEEEDGEITRTGTLLGSPKYMSPEQIQGRPLDVRTDLYSLGVILFQMISGKAPFSGLTSVDIIYKHVHVPVPPISGVAPDVECPPIVEALIEKCLAKDREDRFASMDALIVQLKESLRAVQAGAMIDALGQSNPGLRLDALVDTEPSVPPEDPADVPLDRASLDGAPDVADARALDAARARRARTRLAAAVTLACACVLAALALGDRAAPEAPTQAAQAAQTTGIAEGTTPTPAEPAPLKAAAATRSDTYHANPY